MKTPDRSTAAAFPKYLSGISVADSIALKWQGLFARRWRPPRVLEEFPGKPERRKDPSGNARAPVEHALGFMAGVLAGASKLTHVAHLREDQSLTPHSVPAQDSTTKV